MSYDETITEPTARPGAAVATGADGRPTATSVRWPAAGVLLLGAFALLVLTGCAPVSPTELAGAHPVASPGVRPLLPAGQPDLLDDQPTPLTTTFRVIDGVLLPDPGLTPGALTAGVSLTGLCDPRRARDGQKPHFDAKRRAFSGYGVSIHDRARYEVDLLVPASLGGSNAQKNLWPQPYAGSRGAHQKDVLEAHLLALVCSHRVGLPAAQSAVARNWWAAYRTYLPMPAPSPGGSKPPLTVGLTPTRSVINGGPPVQGARCGQAGQVAVTSRQTPVACRAGQGGRSRWRSR